MHCATIVLVHLMTYISACAAFMLHTVCLTSHCYCDQALLRLSVAVVVLWCVLPCVCVFHCCCCLYIARLRFPPLLQVRTASVPILLSPRRSIGLVDVFPSLTIATHQEQVHRSAPPNRSHQGWRGPTAAATRGTGNVVRIGRECSTRRASGPPRSSPEDNPRAPLQTRRSALPRPPASMGGASSACGTADPTEQVVAIVRDRHSSLTDKTTIPPPSPDQRDHRWKQRNWQSGSDWAIFGTQTLPPPPPAQAAGTRGTGGGGGGPRGRRERRDGRFARRGVATSSPAWPGQPYPVRPVESVPGTQTPDTRPPRSKDALHPSPPPPPATNDASPPRIPPQLAC